MGPTIVDAGPLGPGCRNVRRGSHIHRSGDKPHPPREVERRLAFTSRLYSSPSHLEGYNARVPEWPENRIHNAAVQFAPEEVQMGLQISTRKSGDVTIVDLQGRLIIGVSNDALSAELRRIAEAGPCEVLVNLTGVLQMDSSGISTIVRSFVTLERQGGSLKLLNPLGHVREVLELTRLINSIPTFTDEAKAVASFRGGVAHA